MLNRDDGKRYSLKKSLATKRSFVEARYCSHSGEKLKTAILIMHAAGFELEGIAIQTGLPELHVKAVLDKAINRRSMKK